MFAGFLTKLSGEMFAGKGDGGEPVFERNAKGCACGGGALD